MNTTVKRVLCGASVITVAVLGGIFTRMGMDNYQILAKPSQWPPSWLFPIMWTAIYVLAFVVLFMLCDMRTDKKTFILFGINGVLNVIWCLVFFALRMLFIGEVVLLINLIAAFFLLFDLLRYGNKFFYMTLPYAVWMSLAAALNTAVWILG